MTYSRKHVVLVCLTVLFSSACSTRPAPPRTPVSVVLITIDTLRADHLGIYGGDVPTPHLDAVARAGAVFSNAFTQTPLTLPSHSSILTGTYPTYHGVRDNGRYRLPDELDTLAEILKQGGYRTAAFIGGFPLHSRFGLAQGFDLYDETFPEAPLRLALAERRAEDVLRPARHWLEAHRENRFFLWVHLFDPHAPYRPPAPFEKSYEGEIAYVDRSLGGLLDTLGESTLVVITADHGEGLGEHGERTHSLFLYDATMRIPLIFKGPGIPPGTTVGGEARAIDILPTILELTGHERACTDCQGTSLVPGIRKGTLAPRLSYGETYFPLLNLGWSELKSVRSQGWKYIAAPEPELYDLERDPGETRNLATENPEKLRALATELEKIEATTRRPGAEPTEPTADSETVRILRSLGYVSSSAPPASESRRDPKTGLSIWEDIRHGMELLVRGEWQGVIDAFEPVLDDEPNLVLARSYIAVAYFETGRYQESAKQCVAILESDPSDFEAVLLLAKSYLRLGRKVEARNLLSHAVELDPRSPEPFVELAQSSLESGSLAEAETALRKAEALDPDAPSVLLLRGKFAAFAKNAGEAERLFRKALEKTPLEEDARAQLGNLLLSERRLDEAEALFTEGLRLRPNAAVFHLGLGHTRALAGRMPEAVAELERALALSPNSTLALNSLGFAYLERHETQKGIELLKRSLALEPAQPQIEKLLQDFRAR